MSNFWNGFNFGFSFGMLRSMPMFSCFNSFNFFPTFNFSCFSPFPILPALPDFNSYFNYNVRPSFYSIFDAPPAVPDFGGLDTFWNNQNNSVSTFWNNTAAPTYSAPASTAAPSAVTNTKTTSTSVSPTQNPKKTSAIKTKSNAATNVTGKKCTLDSDTLNKLQQYLRDKEGDGTYTTKNDSGGKTNRGVTHYTYDDYRKRKKLPLQDVSKMTHEEYLEIIQWFWDWSGANKETNPRMAFYRFALRWGGCDVFNDIVNEAHGDPDKFEQLRRNYYYSISKPGSKNYRFRNGWQNRVTWDKQFAEKNFPDIRAA